MSNDYSFNSFEVQLRRLFDEYDSIEVICDETLLFVDLEDHTIYEIEIDNGSIQCIVCGCRGVDSLASSLWNEIEEIGEEWSFLF